MASWTLLSPNKVKTLLSLSQIKIDKSAFNYINKINHVIVFCVIIISN